MDGRELATFQSLINPQTLIPQNVEQVHGIADAMVRGQPTIDQILHPFIEFLGTLDIILLAHNAPFDLGFLAMALIRLGIACPPHDVCDTLDIARRLYPGWHSHSLENVSARLKIANRAEHRALSDARLVKDVFLAMLRRTPTVKSIADLVRISPTRTFAHGPVFSIGAGRFSGTDDAIAERCPSR